MPSMLRGFRCDECSAPVESGMGRWCASHRCVLGNCTNRRDGERQVCAGHVCRAPGCDAPASSRYTRTCAGHRCPYPGCTNLRDPQQESCPAHVCQQDGCSAVRRGFSRHCAEHTLCHNCSRQIDEDLDYCEECYRICAGCDEIIQFHRNGRYCEDCCCEDCVDGGRDRDDDDDDDRPIKRYDANVLDYCTADNGSRLYGIELELEVSGSQTDEAEYYLGKYGDDLIVKSDGSLNCGIELVTRPMTYRNQISFWRAFEFGSNSRVQTTCGMHVHVSRASISNLTLGKALVFINNGVWRADLHTIAGRRGNSYCQYEAEMLNARVIDKIRNKGKYQAINLNKSQTIEFRVFASTTETERLIGRFQFVSSMLGYCEQAPAKTLSITGYYQYLKQTHKSRFRELKRLLHNLNLGGF
jgi:hypothetical protein